MKIYRRIYDNPLNEDGSEKSNDFLGDFDIVETLMNGGYDSLRIGAMEGKVFLITESEVTGYNGGSRFDINELTSLTIR